MSVKTIYFINALRRGTGNPSPTEILTKIQGLHRADIGSALTGFVESVNPHHKAPPKKKISSWGSFHVRIFKIIYKIIRCAG